MQLYQSILGNLQNGATHALWRYQVQISGQPGGKDPLQTNILLYTLQSFPKSLIPQHTETQYSPTHSRSWICLLCFKYDSQASPHMAGLRTPD